METNSNNGFLSDSTSHSYSGSKHGDFQGVFTQQSDSTCDSESTTKRGFVISNQQSLSVSTTHETDLGVSSVPSNGKDLAIVASKGKNGGSGHMVVGSTGESVQQLEFKVRSLEEDNRVMMKEMLAMVRERRELLREVSEMLQVMIMDQPSEKQITEEETLVGST
ncbi:hypothetical protein Syun_002007 [Stephania yunnanensis]|uniref:Uncharacterized protein n=1 Tax=Stephania yunnanensis TaxID=152371 RepID=A0AAP0Q6U0_9MAGN